MTQYKKYLEDNYTKATTETYFKGITIFNNFLGGREITRAVINEFKVYLMDERKVSIRTVSTYFAILRNYFKSNGVTWTFACKNSKCIHKTIYNLK